MLNERLADAFRHSRGYLDTASYGLPARQTARAVESATREWETGALNPSDMDVQVGRMRSAYASIVGSRPEHIALASSTSQFVGMVAASLPAGAHVLVAEEDFTSVLWPFATDPRLTVTAVPLERLVDAVRPGVDLVAVSAAQSRDGRLVDLGALAERADAAGTKTLIDASQSAGWLPMDATRFDVVVASGYKWLTTPRGLAFAAVRPEATWIRPVCASWCGADQPWEHLYGAAPELSEGSRRLDTSPPWQLVPAGVVALELLASHSIGSAYSHAAGLADLFRTEMGLRPAGSAIVSIPAEPCDLAAAGIRAANRAGRVRVGFHVYNDEADVKRAVTALRPVLAAVA